MRRTAKNNTILTSEESGFMTERPYSGMLTSRAVTKDVDYSGLYSSRRNDEIHTAREKNQEVTNISKANSNQRYNQEFNITLGKDMTLNSKSSKPNQFKEENAQRLSSINEDDSLDLKTKEKQSDKDKKNRNKTLLTNITNYTGSSKTEEDELSNEDLKRFHTTLANIKSPRLNDRENIEGNPKKKLEKSNEKPKPKDVSFPGILNYYADVEIKKEETFNRFNTENTQSKPNENIDPKKKDSVRAENNNNEKRFVSKEFERDKGIKNEEKGSSKDKIIDDLKKYNEEVTLNLKNSEKSFSITLAEKERVIHQLTSEKIKLSEKILDFEKNALQMNKELQNLQENLKQKGNIITDLKQENYKLKIEVEKNFESSEPDEEYLKKISKLEGENMKYKMQLENQKNVFQYEYQEQIRKLQHCLEMANLENEYLRSQSANQESNRSQTTSDLSNVSEKGIKKHDAKQKNDKKRDLIGNISQEFDFKIEHDDEKIKDLQEYKKQTHKFLSKLNDLVINLSPPNHYKDTPSLKDIWKWIQNILKEYMNLKKNKSEPKDKYEDIISNFESILKVKSKSELLNALNNLINSEEKSKALLSKFKSMLDSTKINELNEYERRLDRKTVKVS